MNFHGAFFFGPKTQKKVGHQGAKNTNNPVDNEETLSREVVEKSRNQVLILNQGAFKLLGFPWGPLRLFVKAFDPLGDLGALAAGLPLFGL